jgi:hypothetical protein
VPSASNPNLGGAAGMSQVAVGARAPRDHHRGRSGEGRRPQHPGASAHDRADRDMTIGRWRTSSSWSPTSSPTTSSRTPRGSSGSRSIIRAGRRSNSPDTYATGPNSGAGAQEVTSSTSRRKQRIIRGSCRQHGWCRWYPGKRASACVNVAKCTRYVVESSCHAGSSAQ